MFRLRLVLSIAALAAAGARGEAGGDDTATVRLRMLETYGWPASWADAGSLAAGVKQARGYAARLLPNGTWPDVNYDDPQDKTIWLTAEHTGRVQLMAAALSRPGSPAFNDAELFNSTRRALNAWFRLDPYAANWWWYILETPQTIAASFLMLDIMPPLVGQREPFPTDFELGSALNITFRAAWWNASLGYIVTGANLAWLVQAQLLRGVWPSVTNTSALSGGFERLWQEVKLVHWIPGCAITGSCNGTNQGIQADGSVHFHGPQIQTAQYGQDYMSDELAFMAIANGTAWALDSVRVQTLCFYAVGMAWHSAGQGMDWSVAGRALDRDNWGAVSKVVVNATLLELLAPRCNTTAVQATVRAFAASIAGSTPAVVTGHRHFWSSDYSVFKREGWSASWHGLSNRTLPPECGNGENLQGVYESQGVINLVEEGPSHCSTFPSLVDQGSKGPLGWGCGAEYALSFPLLDFKTLNGAIALADLPMPPCAPTDQCCWMKDVVAARRSFVGGVSDGAYGCTAMDTAYLTLKAQKSVFFFDRAILALGVNVSESSGGSAVHTGLASRFLRSEGSGLTLGFANASTSWFAGNETAANLTLAAGTLDWAFADGVGWLTSLVSSAPPARVWAGPRNESWSRIGCYPGTMEGSTLSLAIEQGPGGAPLVDASFAFAIVPETSAAAMALLARPGGLSELDLDIAGLLNTHALQAAVQASASDMVVEAVFWQAGEYAYTGQQPRPWAIEISADSPCVISLHESRDAGLPTSHIVLAASNPDAVSLLLHVTLAAPGRQGCSPVELRLNDKGEDYMGESVVVRLTCPQPPACCFVSA